MSSGNRPPNADDESVRVHDYEGWAATLREMDAKMEEAVTAVARILPTVEAVAIPQERTDLEELRQRFVSLWGPLVRHWRNTTSRIQRPS